MLKQLQRFVALNKNFYSLKILKENEDEENGENENKKSDDEKEDAIYRPPKLVPVYNGNIFRN